MFRRMFFQNFWRRELITRDYALLIVAIVCFLNLTPQQITEDLMRLTTPKVTLREKARNMRAGKKKKSLGSKLAYTQTALAAMGQENKFALVCCASLVLFAAGYSFFPHYRWHLH